MGFGMGVFGESFVVFRLFLVEVGLCRLRVWGEVGFLFRGFLCGDFWWVG